MESWINILFELYRDPIISFIILNLKGLTSKFLNILWPGCLTIYVKALIRTVILENHCSFFGCDVLLVEGYAFLL